MNLRNGKRSYHETLEGFKQDEIKKQQLEEFLKNRDGTQIPQPSSRRCSIKKRQEEKDSLTPAQWQEKNLKTAKALHKLYEKKLDDCDKQCGKLWKINGKLEKIFIEKIIEQSKKDNASKRMLEKIKTNVELLEKQENALKVEQDILTKKTKKLELAAKRLFVNSKRAAAGEYLTELEESTMKYRKNAGLNEDKECGICVSKIGHSRSVVTKSCGHCFHEDCFESWMEVSSSCPFCRSNLEPGIQALENEPNDGGFGRIHDVMSWARTTATNTR